MNTRHHTRWTTTTHDGPTLRTTTSNGKMTLALDLSIARELGFRLLTSSGDHNERIREWKRANGYSLPTFGTWNL